LIDTEIIITGLVLLGAALALGVYHLFLYTQYKERVIIAYSIYLFSLALYIAAYLISVSYYPSDQYAFINYVKESMSLLTVLGYCYFLYAVLEEWHEEYKIFFRLVWVAIAVMSVYCVFIIIAGLLQLRGNIITTVLPNASRLILLSIALVGSFLFFPLMKGNFLRLIKWGSAVYLFIVALIVLTFIVSDQKFFGLDNMYLFFAGVFIDLIIFSMAMAYKVKSVFVRILEIRQKISQDLHDDIGASLSSLQIYGAIAEKTFKDEPQRAIEMLHKISVQSKAIMENMGDIVWSMKTSDSSTTSLEAKIKNYSVELLGDNNIDFKFSIAPAAEIALKNATARKNILLIAKEAMNNIAKYSKAKNAELHLHIQDKELILLIKDDGIGFERDLVKKGNGLENMEQRTVELNGKFNIQSGKNKGTMIRAFFPVHSIH
jgi:signal transduction histidine kinase